MIKAIIYNSVYEANTFGGTDHDFTWRNEDYCLHVRDVREDNRSDPGPAGAGPGCGGGRTARLHKIPTRQPPRQSSWHDHQQGRVVLVFTDGAGLTASKSQLRLLKIHPSLGVYLFFCLLRKIM